MGPGPGGLNLRSEVICQKPSSIKTTFAQSKRDTSQERDSKEKQLKGQALHRTK